MGGNRRDTWARAVPTTGFVELPPEARSMQSLGRNHVFETAIADLVDNSVDARARNALVRFVRDGDRLVGLLVIDDGKGMTERQIDVAMTVGGRRNYGAGEIGRFGLGLKAASFSQAKSFTVVSRTHRSEPSGRRWQLTKAKNQFLCDVVDTAFAAELLDREWGLPSHRSGTIIRWDDVTGFPSVADANVIDRFLASTITKLRKHLGLVFHRLLEQALTSIFIDVQDLRTSSAALRYEVEPLNPFNYLRTGRVGYPAVLLAGTNGRQLGLACHIWPGRSSVDEFNLPGGPLERQGFYFYLRDRLIQSGGWNGVQHPDRRLSLARVAIDIDGDIDGVLSLKPEKTGIETGPDFSDLVRTAKDGDGLNFAGYLNDAEATYRDARKRRARRRAVMPPGKGLDPIVKRAIAAELRHVDAEAPIDIRWSRFYGAEFFEIDREERTIWLNERYRPTLLGGRRGSLNDLPVVKTLLYLLMEDIFHGQYLGPRDKDNIELWQALLTSAATSEVE